MKYHLSGKTSILPETLMLRDEQYGWTAFHALFSYRGIDLQRRTSIFKEFQSMRTARGVRPIQLLKSQDRDGDTVFHSAINHRVDKEVIKMMISKFQRKTAKSLLQVQNRKKLTPLQRAFQLREWELVKVLLSQCIELNILPGLTGVRANISKTLLHRAFGLADHAAEYLRIHLRTCRECRISNFEVMQSLLVKDKKLLTPWHYLANEKDDDVIKAVVAVAVEHGIDINELYIDETRSTLLHQMEKQCRPALAEFLESRGANPRQVNCYGLRPIEKRKVFDVENSDQPMVHYIFEEAQEEHETSEASSDDPTCPEGPWQDPKEETGSSRSTVHSYSPSATAKILMLLNDFFPYVGPGSWRSGTIP